MARNNTPEACARQYGAVIALATVYNGSAPGANTNIITPVKVSDSASTIRVTVCLATASVFNVVVTNGSTPFTMGLNASSALQAGDLYTFTFGARRYSSQTGTTELTYSFQVETDGVINYLLVEEVTGPVL